MHSASFYRDTVIPIVPKSPGAASGSSDEVETLHPGAAKLKMTMPHQLLPKDRPFTNLASSAEMPPVYAAIFEANIDPVEKARNLRAALRRDNFQLCAYFLMLASLGSLALFQLCGGEFLAVSTPEPRNPNLILPNQGTANYGTKERFISAYSWEAWSYLVPAILLALSALHDAIKSNNDDKEVADLQAISFASRKFNAAPISTIQLSQTVEVVEEYQMESKKLDWEDFSRRQV
jgi:hypothetical protein